MTLYELRFFRPGAELPAVDRADFADDRSAVMKGVSELLQMPSRERVEVWSGLRLVYSRTRTER